MANLTKISGTRGALQATKFTMLSGKLPNAESKITPLIYLVSWKWKWWTLFRVARNFLMSFLNFSDKYRIEVDAPILLPHNIKLLTMYSSSIFFSTYLWLIPTSNAFGAYRIKIQDLSPTESHIFAATFTISVKIEQAHPEA